MASLKVGYVSKRHECAGCEHKKGFNGISSQCMAIEVLGNHHHKFYHPKCFFENSANFDKVFKELEKKQADGIEGFEKLKDSDRMMIHYLFAIASDDGLNEEDAKEERERMERTKKRQREAAAKRTKKEEENKANREETEARKKEEKARKREANDDIEEEEVSPKKKRSAVGNKDTKKRIEIMEDEEEIVPSEKTRRSSGRLTKRTMKESDNTGVEASEEIVKPIKETKKATRRGLRERKNETVDAVTKSVSPVKTTDVTKILSPVKNTDEEQESPVKKPSEAMQTFFRHTFNRDLEKKDEGNVRLESDSDSD